MVLKLFTKADQLILRGFIGPYLVAFFIVEFVLVMQFLWKFIDDILGRGYGVTDYLELIGYMSVTIIPLALPLTVLLSSVMVYGDHAEHYELSSLKSAGLSLNRLLRPGLAVAIFTALFSILASNYFKPLANEAFLRKFNAMRLSKVTFALEEKVFNLDFRDHAIYVGKKKSDGVNLEQVLIYYTNPQDQSLLNVISAQRAKMRTSSDGKYLIMDLYEGKQYQEDKDPGSNSNYLTHPDREMPVSTASFSRYRKVFELSDIFKDMSELSLERKKHDMLNSRQLVVEIDSMNAKQAQKMEENKYDYNELIQIGLESFDLKKYINGTSNGQDIEIDTQTNETVSVRKSLMDKNISTVLLNKKDVALDSLNNVLAWITPDVRATVIDLARKKNGTLKTRTWNNYSQVRNINYSKQDFVRSLNVQYSWAIVCILFLFIGAPMGAIVRKGGFGYPMLVAIGFYMFFIILTILSERLQKSSVIDGFQAGWLPCIVLLPFAAITSYMAMNDIKIDRSFFISWIPIRKKNLVVP